VHGLGAQMRGRVHATTATKAPKEGLLSGLPIRASVGPGG
jgi:hypothetical protein